jgi:hypothetical protein
MNCPQCQAANAPDAGFCGNCGARLSSPAPADQSGYQSSPGYSPSSSGSSSIGHEPPTVYNAPAYKAPPPPSAYNTPQAPSYDAQPGYNAQPGYGGPSGGGQAPGGYGQQGGQPGGYGQGGYGQAPGGQAPGGYPPPGAQPPGGYPPPGGQAPGGQAPGGYPPQSQYQPGTQGGFRQRSSGGIQPVNFNLARLVLTDRIVAVASLIALISLFLSWYTASITEFGATEHGSASGVNIHGWLWLEFIVALAIIVYLVAVAAWETLPFSLPVPHPRLLLGATGLQFLLLLIAFIALPDGDGASVSWGFGAFIGLLAGLVALAAAIPQVVAYVSARFNRGRAGGPGTPIGGPPRGY